MEYRTESKCDIISFQPENEELSNQESEKIVNFNHKHFDALVFHILKLENCQQNLKYQSQLLPVFSDQGKPPSLITCFCIILRLKSG